MIQNIRTTFVFIQWRGNVLFLLKVTYLFLSLSWWLEFFNIMNTWQKDSKRLINTDVTQKSLSCAHIYKEQMNQGFSDGVMHKP